MLSLLEPAHHGSSPRARGTLSDSRLQSIESRFIPACAGNTVSGMGRSPTSPVHPRVRGEHHTCRDRFADFDGSSPRARGTRNDIRGRFINVRFIPACAGNTAQIAAADIGRQVHPRVRGEHSPSTPDASAPHGSSPRARGTLSMRPIMRSLLRFIPACAGNTWRSHNRSATGAVHPRVRGEHVTVTVTNEQRNGSSPRARGTPGSVYLQPWCNRFIPACAGNTVRMHGCARLRAVHPRVRGEHTRAAIPLAIVRGSSPRARGTPKETPANG